MRREGGGERGQCEQEEGSMTQSAGLRRHRDEVDREASSDEPPSPPAPSSSAQLLSISNRPHLLARLHDKLLEERKSSKLFDRST
eukprot:758232-Hanusia_phi.AAC.2